MKILQNECLSSCREISVSCKLKKLKKYVLKLCKIDTLRYIKYNN